MKALSYALGLIMLSNVNAQVPPCVDEPGWQTYDPESAFTGVTCDDLAQKPGPLCDFFYFFPSQQSTTSYDACCACKGHAPSSTPSVTPTYKPSSRPSVGRTTPSPSLAPSTCQDDPTYYVPLGDNQSHGCEILTWRLCHKFYTVSVNQGTMSPYDACCTCMITMAPSSVPSKDQTQVPSLEPSSIPSSEPSSKPSSEPTNAP